MASKNAEAMKVLFRSWQEKFDANPDISVEEIREIFDHWGDITAEPRAVDYSEVDCDGVPAMWAIPKGASDRHVLLCTHGGGYISGSMYTHRKMFGHIAKTVGCRALIVDYRRAPEHPHPRPINDVVTAYAWLLDQGFAPARIATTGDSAGGALATAVVIAARDRGLPLPAAVMPISPWYDTEATGETMQSRADVDCLVRRDSLLEMAEALLDGGSPRDPLANPLHAGLAGLPPIYIQVGDHEVLLDDSVMFADKARAAGVEVKLDVFPEMQHVFHMLAGAAPEADDAIRQMADWVRPKLGLA